MKREKIKRVRGARAVRGLDAVAASFGAAGGFDPIEGRLAFDLAKVVSAILGVESAPGLALVGKGCASAVRSLRSAKVDWDSVRHAGNHVRASLKRNAREMLEALQIETPEEIDLGWVPDSEQLGFHSLQLILEDHERHLWFLDEKRPLQRVSRPSRKAMAAYFVSILHLLSEPRDAVEELQKRPRGRDQTSEFFEIFVHLHLQLLKHGHCSVQPGASHNAATDSLTGATGLVLDAVQDKVREFGPNLLPGRRSKVAIAQIYRRAKRAPSPVPPEFWSLTDK